MRRTAFVSVVAIAFASTALAADLPPRSAYKAPYPTAVAYNWTGFYIGGHIGYGWSTLTGTDPTDGTVSNAKLKGILGGGQLGYNYQIGSIVLGIEGDFSIADVKLANNDPFGFGGGSIVVKNDYFATVAGRIGYAFDRALWYAKGGGAFTRDKWDFNDGAGNTLSGRFNRTGWMAGAGLEYAVWDNWSAKLEYNYLSFSGMDQHISDPTGLTTFDANNVSLKSHLLKLGFNYKFF
jgi:outer membrane immunogenic protein